MDSPKYAHTDHQGGLSEMAMTGLDALALTAEAQEGAAAFVEKRKRDFDKCQVEH